MTGRPGGLIVRVTTAADAAAVAELRVRTWRAAYRGVVPDAYLDAMPLGDDAFRAARERFARLPGAAHHLVAERAGAVTGFVVCGPDREPAGPDGVSGEVYALYVAPEHWSTGAGRTLLDAARGLLGADGYPYLTLWVLAANDRARRFYQRSGLRVTGERRLVTLGRPVPEVRYGGPLAGGRRWGSPAAGRIPG
jgi:ribosomal protein S18 acetylase RimI-like enzyme